MGNAPKHGSHLFYILLPSLTESMIGEIVNVSHWHSMSPNPKYRLRVAQFDRPILFEFVVG